MKFYHVVYECVLLEQKKIKLFKNVILWKIEQRLCSMSYNAVKFFVAKIYKMNF